jgi:hypothetical protein
MTNYGGNSILALQILGSSLYDSKALMKFAGAAGWPQQNTGLLANTYMKSSPGLLLGPCGVTFNDPMDDIINSFREIGLRISIGEAAHVNGGNETFFQSVSYESLLNRIEYAVEFKNLAVAVIVSLIGPMATLLLFWGWWGLGRTFSMSPLEVACAFQSPPGGNGLQYAALCDVLSHYGGNTPVESILKGLRKGDHQIPPDPDVRYGVDENTNQLLIGLTGPNFIRAPKRGEVI